MRPGSRNIGQIALAVIVGYLSNGILVFGSESAFMGLSHAASLPYYYYFADLAAQCLFTVVGGYLCRWVAGHGNSYALVALSALGIFLGTISLVTSWNTEPHWYGIALLAVYVPCALVGWELKNRTGPRASSTA